MAADEDVPLTFVVGTGRCGSTALSNILNLHPNVLSLSELLTSIGHRALPDTWLSGADFWPLIARPNPAFDAMIRGGVALPELLYPRSPGRYAATTTGIPALSLVVLPHLTDDPDALFDELADEVPSWPSRPVTDHYRALFSWLCTRFNRDVAVERSGYSLHRVSLLSRRFPAAKFVHLYRNGPDCALSMSTHPGLRTILLRYRITDMLGVDSVFDLLPADVAALPPELAGIFPDRFDPDAVRQPLPLADFGRLWSRLVREGLRLLDEVPSKAQTSVAYERILDQPEAELTRLADFIGFEPTGDWLSSARAILDPGRRGVASRLPPKSFSLLEQACAPGERALADHYPVH